MSSLYPSNPWLGRSLGDNQRYRLDRRLGGGGMGDVFLATDIRIGQQVALKLLKDNLVESPEMRQRFEHEIAICAALQNEHIVKIMDSGVTPEGYPFYVMEYLRGITLGELLRAEPRLSIDRTANIISQVCNGLLQAHQGVDLPGGEHIEAVIHRDLKPDNIFLQPTDLGEWVKIVDFGIAKIRYKDRQNQTLTHTFLGTLRYASPEQMMGDRELDARSDIYSLGVILYEMLSGADPFGFNIQPRPMSEASWIIAHTSEPPISLRSQPGCDRLPENLEAVARRCLEKNPDLRFASVGEFNLALQAAVKPPSAIPNLTNEGRTIVQPRPGVTPDTNNDNDETIAKAISAHPPATSAAINPSQLETIERSLTPVEPVNSATLEETIAQQIPAPPGSSSLPMPEPVVPPIMPVGSKNIVPPLSPPLVEGKTQVQPRPASANITPPLSPPTGSQSTEHKTQVQPRPPVSLSPEPTPHSFNSTVKPNDKNTPWLKIAIGSLLGLGLIGGIYVFTQSRPAPVVVVPNSAEKPIESSPTTSASPTTPTTISSNSDGNNATTDSLAAAIKSLDDGSIKPDDEAKLRSAIDSASKIPQSSPDYAKVQTLSKDAAHLSAAIKLVGVNPNKLTEAIAEAEKISSQSHLFNKAQAYIKKWKEI
jgi:eukaryotic-like serine/threonine-protein kinase